MHLVMHNVVSHYQKCWYIFCRRSVLKVSAMSREWHLGDGSWHTILVLCYIMFICTFISQRSFIICAALWFPPAFGGIKLVSGSFYRFMMLNRYTGFCWFITTDSVIPDYRSRGVKIPGTQFQYLITRLIARSHEVSKPRGLCKPLSDRSEIWQTPQQQC